MNLPISDLSSRLFQLDSSLWSQDPQVQSAIQNRLGWLKIFQNAWFEEKALPQLEQFSQHLQDFSTVVLIGMGGSSLCADMLLRISGAKSFFVLDSTHPDAVRSLESKVNLSKSLFIIASKSGSTLEIDALKKYFFHKINNPFQFVAITDEASPLHHEMSEENGFIPPLINPSDIGGRYSALSLFGLVPALCMGLDIEKMYYQAKKLFDAPQMAIELGLFLNEQVKQGKTQVAFELPPQWLPFEDWVEQLIAESTGKQGKGLLPLQATSNTSASQKAFVEYGYKARHQGSFLISTKDSSTEALGAEFLRYEIATAVLSAKLNINPFDEPHVRLAKDFTQKALASDLQITSTLPSKEDFNAFLKTVPREGYIALLAFVEMNEENMDLLSLFQSQLQSRWGVSCTLGFGPRYLHSTGQFHKDGPITGRFIVITDQCKDLSIHGSTNGFKKLIHAQAQGDFEALKLVKQGVMRLDLSTLNDLRMYE